MADYYSRVQAEAGYVLLSDPARRYPWTGDPYYAGVVLWPARWLLSITRGGAPGYQPVFRAVAESLDTTPFTRVWDSGLTAGPSGSIVEIRAEDGVGGYKLFRWLLDSVEIATLQSTSVTGIDAVDMIVGQTALYDDATFYGKHTGYLEQTKVWDTRGADETWGWDSDSEIDDWVLAAGDWPHTASSRLYTRADDGQTVVSHIRIEDTWLGLGAGGTMLYRDSTGVLWRADSTGAAITVQYQVAAPATWSSPVTVASGDYAQPGIWDGGDGYLYLSAFNNGDSKKYQWRRTGGLATWTADGEIT